MSKGCVVVYKGKFLYGAVNRFAELIAEGFRAEGYDAPLIDLTQGVSFLKELKPIMDSGSCKAIFSFAGAGSELRLEDGRLLHDVLGVPFVAAMVDDVAHFPNRFCLEKMLVGCVDESHFDYLARRFGPSKRPFLLPHGGCPPPEPFDGPYEARPVEILFPGSFLDPAAPASNIAKMSPQARLIAENALKLYDSVDEMAPREALLQAAKSLGCDTSHPRLYAFLLDELFSDFEMLVRARRRVRALKALDDAGLAVEIYGENWPHGLFKHHKIGPSLPFEEVLALMASSKIVLNMRSMPGSHERAPSAAMAGALVLSDFNSLVARQFEEGREIAFFRWTSCESELPRLAAALLAAPAKAASIAAAGRARAFAEHTWRASAKVVLRALEPA
jgi:hypothetical protein